MRVYHTKENERSLRARSFLLCNIPTDFLRHAYGDFFYIQETFSPMFVPELPDFFLCFKSSWFVNGCGVF